MRQHLFSAIKAPFTLEGVVTGLVWSILPAALWTGAVAIWGAIKVMPPESFVALCVSGSLIAIALTLVGYNRWRAPKVRARRGGGSIELTVVPKATGREVAPRRVKHRGDCPFVYLLIHREDHDDGRWDRVTRCEGCEEQAVDDHGTRSKERGRQGWGVWHGENELLDNITLGVGTLVGDQCRIYECNVTAPDGETHTYNAIRAGQGIYGDDPSRIGPRESVAAFYPQQEMFPDAPRVPKDGIYGVEWRALADGGPGDYFLKEDEFEIRDGRLAR